jgi:hypothetical protein
VCRFGSRPRRLAHDCLNCGADPEMSRPHIEYFGHKETFDQLTAFFPGLKPEDMPDGEAWGRLNGSI